MLIDSSNMEYYKWILGIFIFILAVIRTGGVSFVFRFILKIIRLKFDDKAMEAENNRWFDLQLYRFISGVNVSNIEDALFIQRNVREGKLKGVFFWGAGFFGTIGKKVSRWDVTGVLGIALASFFIMIFSGLHASSYKIGFATYRFDDGSFMHLNAEKIFDPSKKKEIDCENISEVKAGGKNYAIICDYFMHVDTREKQKIKIGIKYANETRSTYISISVVSFIVWAVLFFGFLNYLPLNRKVLELKKNEASLLSSTND